VLHRLVIALTALLGLVGAAVVVGYLLIFSTGTDRLARAVPDDAAAYATVYLQPTTGQKMNLSTLLGHVPGFADAAGLDQKLHEISARFLGQAGVDYEADVRPWIGNQLSIAARPGATLTDQPALLVLVDVKDRDSAAEAMQRIAAGRGQTATESTHQGQPISVADDFTWALLDELLIVAVDQPSLEAALDAEADRRSSLADDAAYVAAMRRLPADHLAAAYLDLAQLADTAGVGEQVAGYSTVSAALIAEPNGLRLQGVAPFDAEAAPSAVRGGFALASEPSSLASWMPAESEATAVLFGMRRAVETAEQGLAGEPGAQEITDALSQLRALAAFGLGIDLDDDLLPLFDAEAGLAVRDLTTTAPAGQLLLRPSDEGAAAAALDRMRDALGARGGQVSEREAEGTTVTTIDLPQVISLAWAMADGVIVAGLSHDDVAAALGARASGDSVAASDRYRAAWDLAGDRGGNEAFVDIGAIVDASGDALGMTGDARDILLSIGALGLTVPAHDDTSEFHVVLIAR
jgi:hypothetical protein